MRLASFVPSRSRSGKVVTWLLGAVALTFFACCGSVGFIAIQSNKKKQEALVEADALYPSKPAEAIARYKEGYDVAGSRKAEVLQRIVDHEATKGSAAEATRWVEKGLDDNLTPAYTSVPAKALLAKAQKERAEHETARQAEAAAKKAERDAKAKDRDDKNRKYTRDEFKRLVIGKTRDEVIALLGKPKATQQSGELEFWDYMGRTTDPVTGKIDNLAQVEFEGDRVTGVTFTRL